jgi:hypothetical protein
MVTLLRSDKEQSSANQFRVQILVHSLADERMFFLNEEQPFLTICSELLTITEPAAMHRIGLGFGPEQADPIDRFAPSWVATLGEGKVIPALECDRIEESGEIFDTLSEALRFSHEETPNCQTRAFGKTRTMKRAARSSWNTA